MSFMSEFFKSIFRTLGRVVAYIIVGFIIYLLCTNFVDAQIIREGSVSNASNTKLYTAYNFTRMNYTGQWSYLSLYYDISGSSGQNILFSTNYRVETDSTNVSRISMSIWYIGTDGSWNQIIDNCQRSGTRTDGQNSSSWDLQIVCNIPTTKNFSEIAVSINMLDRNGNNMNTPYLRFIQKSSSISTSGTSNESIGNSINNNNDKNTSIIINNADANAEKITAGINGLNDSLTDDSAPTDYSFFDDIGLSSDTPISNLVLMPITLLSAINNGFGGVCSQVNLGSLLGHDLVIPCIDLESKLGSDLWSKIDSLISIFLIYEICLMIVGAFEDMTSLNDSYTNLIARHSSENVSYTPRHGGS